MKWATQRRGINDDADGDDDWPQEEEAAMEGAREEVCLRMRVSVNR